MWLSLLGPNASWDCDRTNDLKDPRVTCGISIMKALPSESGIRDHGDKNRAVWMIWGLKHGKVTERGNKASWAFLPH